MGRQITLAQAKQIALASKDSLWAQARRLGRDVKIYIHWTAGHYDQTFDHYHFNILKNGKIYTDYNDISEVISHTYKRNTGAVGIALTCCYNANSNNLGPEPPTDAQIESLAMLVAVLAKALDLTIDLARVMTHAEAADNMDGLAPHEKYGPATTCERWDLAILKNGDDWMSGGDTIRGKANWYNQNYPNGVENA